VRVCQLVCFPQVRIVHVHLPSIRPSISQSDTTGFGRNEEEAIKFGGGGSQDESPATAGARTNRVLPVLLLRPSPLRAQMLNTCAIVW